MFFISAQPDAVYFKWQLEVQLTNFKKVGIPAENIHVLIGYEPAKGISKKMLELANEQKSNACFFFYSDDRVAITYAPTIRPHIIKKHFLDFPYLKDECIFYHDSDIIFRELPDFKRLCTGDTWYVSDTRRYLDVAYIKSIGNVIFYEMCEVLNIDRSVILKNDENTGGAQYLMKGINYQFWDKIEQDCDLLYKYLNENKDRYVDMKCQMTGISRSDYRPLQSWCTDMWVIYWNALSLGYQVKIDKELDFCWPYQTLDKWEETKILHNAGVPEISSDLIFYKGAFHNNDPYDINFDTMLKDICSIKYIEAIQQYKDFRRINLSDVTFIITVNNHSQDELNNLYTTVNFINKYFKTNVLVLEAGDASCIDDSKLPACVERVFVLNNSGYFHKSRYNNLMIHKAQTAIISLCDPDVIFPASQIEDCVNKIRNGECAIAYPYERKCVAAWDPDLKPFFLSKLDVRMFSRGVSIESNQSFGGAVFVNRELYIQCGMDNELITEGAIENMERLKRMEILGFKFQRIDGALYHLSYQRDINYNINSGDRCEPSLEEYLRICKMSKEELTNEIANWNWSNAHPQPVF